jgi:hypothetical protein
MLQRRLLRRSLRGRAGMAASTDPACDCLPSLGLTWSRPPETLRAAWAVATSPARKTPTRRGS